MLLDHSEREDQARAVQLGLAQHPILAIQAAFGTGKTVVGALIAVRLATSYQPVLVTATTNVAVAQLTDTLLKLKDHRDLNILRFVSDSALKEGAPTTSGLLANYPNLLNEEKTERLTRYRRGRELLERLLLRPETTIHLTDEEREEFGIAENQNSEATEDAVKIMLRVRYPSILCITTASFLNVTKPGGLFPMFSRRARLS
ncbi:hypothetical protein GCK32_022845 [Trichostrongylus colubriformis]|uniref:DNA2/NAM7 helicase helicase domain-containing protein n=1 Tax=Trichostrongylus colubriformis TaxID=6319 RepID=A0AAN8IZH8_TRICO